MGEFERVEASQRDMAGNSGLDASESIGAASYRTTGTFIASPLLDDAQLALDNLKKRLHPPWASHVQRGGYKDPGLDPYLRTGLKEMKQFLWTYVSPQSMQYNKWTAASLHTAKYLGKKPYHTQLLRERVCAFMENPEDPPHNPYRAWNESILDHDETLAQNFHLHLQKIGRYVRAEDLVDFMDTPEMRERTDLDRRISVLTTQRWMKKLDYRWTKTGLK